MMKVHFLGIGGSGASAAAAIAQSQGFEVTGCDLNPHNEFTTTFQPDQLFTGHTPEHLSSHLKPHSVILRTKSEGSSPVMGDSSLVAQNDKDKKNDKVIDILAVTPAIFSLDSDNPELLAAKKKGIPILTWQEFVGKYLTKDRRGLFSRRLKNKFVIAVCGTHGKTTTTAMIAKMLEDTALDPTVLLGAIVPKWGTNYRLHRQTGVDRHYFVMEADEFNDNFLPTKPDITVITNIEMDHPEYFKDFEAVKESFKKFLLQTKKTIIANLSDPVVRQILNVHPKGVNIIVDYSKEPIDFALQIPGEFNVMNASATYQIGLILGIDPETIKKSLQSYTGVERRFEYIGQYNGAKIYSDFGHHPTEIEKTMEAARQKFPKSRIWLIYEPHMFTRTKALFNDFVKVFKKIPVDKIIITDIYPSREVDTGLVSSQQLVQAIGYDRLVYHNKKQLPQILKQEIRKDDIIFFMGAGDIDQMARGLVS